MPTTNSTEQNGQDYQAGATKQATTNLSVDFVERRISLVETSRCIDDIDRFVPVEEASGNADRM